MTTEAPATSWAQRAAAAAAGAAGNASSAADASTATAAADAAARQTFDSRRYVVLDTNALLISGNGGMGLSRYAKSGSEGEAETPAVLVTTSAALAEVRDAASREALERTRGTGVCELSLREPEEEDVKAGKRVDCVWDGERRRRGRGNREGEEIRSGRKKLDAQFAS